MKLTFSIVRKPPFYRTDGRFRTKAEYIRHRVQKVSYLIFHNYSPFQLHCPYFTETFDFYIYSYWWGYSIVNGNTRMYFLEKIYITNWNVFSKNCKCSKWRDADKQKIIWMIIWNPKMFWYQFCSLLKIFNLRFRKFYVAGM